MGIRAFFSRLFRGKKQTKITELSYEDRVALANIDERKTLAAAVRKEEELKFAVQEYKQKEQEGATKALLISLEKKVKRANATYAAALQALRSRGTNLEVLEQISNNDLIKEAAGINVSSEELDESVRGAIEARQKEDDMKIQADVGKRMVDEVLEDTPYDTDALLHPNQDKILDLKPQQVQAQQNVNDSEILNES